MTVQEAPAPNGDDDSASPAVVWRNCAGTYLGVDQHDRVWGVSPSLLGWRLEVRNADEASWAYLGTHSTRDAAQQAASEADAAEDGHERSSAEAETVRPGPGR